MNENQSTEFATPINFGANLWRPTTVTGAFCTTFDRILDHYRRLNDCLLRQDLDLAQISFETLRRLVLRHLNWERQIIATEKHPERAPGDRAPAAIEAARDNLAQAGAEVESILRRTSWSRDDQLRVLALPVRRLGFALESYRSTLFKEFYRPLDNRLDATGDANIRGALLSDWDAVESGPP